jgi:ABC-type Fe3+/spermidine/putrescine transport system ATPase subunit/ABC-type sulfate transport system permease component
VAARTPSPLTWLSGLIVLYLTLPIVAFLLRFATSRERGFHVPGLASSLWVSVSCAVISLVLITLFGVPLAYVLARSTGRVASVVGILVQVPLALPPLMSGVVLVYLVGPYTFLGRLFGGRLTNSRIGVVIAMTFVAAPFLIVAARAAFAAVDEGLLDVAATLGHSEISRFWRVAVPVAGGGIRAGMVLSFLRAFGEYGAVVVLAYNPATLPIYTYNQFSGVGLSTTLAPTALAIVVAVVVVAMSRVRRRRPGHVTTDIEPVAPVLAPSEPISFDVDHHLGGFHLAMGFSSSTRHVAVLGPSGSGKSALLRCLAGLYGPRAGELHHGATSLRDVRPEQRRVGYVAQGFSLFPHLTVWEQLLFATRATPAVAAYWIGQLGLAGLEARLPSQLSGGQRQRVALAQVLSNSPQVVLLDEPFSALDVVSRLELRRELRRLQREIGLTTILVTHDPEEAAFLADEVVVISDGHAIQSGDSREVFSRPASLEVARLLGISNLFSGVIAAPGVIDVSGATVEMDDAGLEVGSAVSWSIRPERIHVVAEPSAAPSERTLLGATLVGVITDVVDVGTATDLFVEVNTELELMVRTSDIVSFGAGERCAVVLPYDAISVWPTELVNERA